ncbi:MAG: ATP-binding protein [Spirochaetaceae bacterium]|nr:MAG: ATP-binding protein [Spirochaetaceae bacterium]
MSEIKLLDVNEDSKLFDKTGMFYKEFDSDFRQIRYYTLLVVQKAPSEIKEINLLEQQISEIIKNAVKHGNRCDPKKKVKVWYYFSVDKAHLIVEDEGDGFKDLEKWNEFNKKRVECFVNQNFDEMESYISFKTKKSDEHDSGNAMFAAVEYWNGGVVYNTKKNSVAVLKTFPRKKIGLDMSSL